MKIQLFIVFMVVAALTVAVAAEPLPVTKPENVGMSSQRLERIGWGLRADIDKGLMPGAVVAIARRGKLVYYESFGFLDKGAGTPMPKDAIFAIASMTKPLTAVGALVLYEEDRLLLNDPVSKYLPQLDRMPVAVMHTDPSGKTVMDTEPAKRKPTLQDLMRHTAGVTYGNRGDSELYKLYATLSPGNQTGPEFLDRLGELPLHYQPGKVWDYSLGFDVLGLAIESVTKQSLGQYLQERLFTPLGMVDTGFMLPPAKVDRYAKPLAFDPETGKPQVLRDPSKPPAFDCGGGCGYSTAMDYLRFAEMLRNQGRLDNTRILGRKTVEYMTSDQLGPEVNIDRLREYPNINGYGFGLGVAVRRSSGVAGIMGTPGDFHWGGAFGTYFWVDPKEELTAVFMAAAPGEVRIHFRQVITALVLQAVTD
jgi:CubicO group peptidase (beta-lactamase class C family)